MAQQLRALKTRIQLPAATQHLTTICNSVPRHPRSSVMPLHACAPLKLTLCVNKMCMSLKSLSYRGAIPSMLKNMVLVNSTFCAHGISHKVSPSLLTMALLHIILFTYYIEEGMNSNAHKNSILIKPEFKH